ncbi:MAG: cation diffusion facilitator family transporter [bacterium]
MHNQHSHAHLQTKYGYIEGIVSIIVNTLLFALKLWIGIMTSSVALIADAWHTISDSLTSVLVIIGFKLSSMPADRQHPFGHGRAEIITSVVIGSLLGSIGFHILIDSINRLINNQSAEYNTPAVIICIISIAVKEALARFSFWCGKKTDSQSLIADAWHHRSDAVTSIIILIGIYLDTYLWWIDGFMGLVVSIFIFYTTYAIMKNSISLLIGIEPEYAFIQKLNRLVSSCTNVDIKLHHIHMHHYGGHKELTFHIVLPKDMKLADAHHISDCIEAKLREELHIETTIHIEPS